jgi:phenylacetate-coenzyme A ligase PaaK-like adenylate-forming protein
MTEWSRRLWRAYEKSPAAMKDGVATLYGAWQRQRRYGSFFRAHRLALEESQWWDPEKIAFATAERLRRFAHRAATTVPYYRDLFLQYDVAPDGIRDAADLMRLPIMDWETARQEYKRLQPEADDVGAAVVLRTPGPELASLAVPVTQECFEREWAFRWQQLSWRGLKPGERKVTLADDPMVVSLGPEPPYWVTNHAESELLLSYRRLNERTVPIYAAKLAEWQPVLLHGPPSALEMLALGLRVAGETSVRPRMVVAEGETLTWEQRAAIELQFRCKVSVYYSSAEMVAHAAECEVGSLHVRPEHSLVEFLNERGEPAAPGEPAEIVGTGFGNPAFPLIRYRTGDAAVLSERPCVCNRGGLTLRSLTLGAYRPIEAIEAEAAPEEGAVAEAA